MDGKQERNELPTRIQVANKLHQLPKPRHNGIMHFNDAAGATLANYAEFMTYDQRTQGHLNSDGLCYVKAN